MAASTSKWEKTGIVAVAKEGGDAGNFNIAGGPGPANIATKTRYIDLTLTTATSAAQLKVMTLGAGTYVRRVQAIGTAGENLTLSLGDSASPSTFLTTASQSTAAAQTAWTTGKYYSSADEINMTWSNAASNFKGLVIVDYSVLSTTGN